MNGDTYVCTVMMGQIFNTMPRLSTVKQMHATRESANYTSGVTADLPEQKNSTDTSSGEDTSKLVSAVSVKWGAPVLILSWRSVKRIALLSVVANVVIILMSLLLFGLGISTKQSIGDFINMVTEGDGTAIPLCLMLAGFFSLPLSAAFIYSTWKSCGRERNRIINAIHFMLIVVALCLIVVLISLTIFCLVHAYSSLQDRLHSGISDAMAVYNSSPVIKARVDILQITFQCCGSKSYKEWFDLQWFSTSGADLEAETQTRDDVPFSCCSIHSPFPCVHHGVMSAGSRYLYAPETNLSVSGGGCQPALLLRTRALAWAAGLALLLLAALLGAVAAAQRLLQTAHAPAQRYERHGGWHTAWLLGCYTGRRGRLAPRPPPIPEELMR